jgi:hypothetical protein
MTWEDEEFVIKRFQEMYNSLPEGNLEHKPSPWPDFVLSVALGKNIGIELTQAVHSDDDKRISSTKNTFTDLVLAKLVSLLSFHFSISVSPFPKVGVGKAEKEKLAKEVAVFCSKEFSSLQNMEHRRVEHVDVDLTTASAEIKNHLLNMDFRNLPKGIQSISILRFDEHGESFNSQSEATAIPFFTKERLMERLEDKESKLKGYNFCDEYWLVIWQGGGITGYFKEINFEIPIQSKFDKVFILRSVQNDLLILKE